jgi:hypothetical protein
VRGKYAARLALGSNIVMIKPEIFAAFPSEEAVNEALAMLLRVGQEYGTKAPRRRSASTAAQDANSR